MRQRQARAESMRAPEQQVRLPEAVARRAAVDHRLGVAAYRPGGV